MFLIISEIYLFLFRTHVVLVLTAFLFLFPYKLMAENKVISIEDGWNIVIKF